MKKIIMILIIFLSIILNINVYALSNDSFQNGIMLDVARRYYSVDEIKKYIDELALEDNTFLQLHLTDDENVGIENTFLNQTESNAIKVGDIYTNPDTNKSFLTYKQVKEIMDYCKKNNVEFIPEIDIPAHMTGFFTLARIKFGNEYVDKFAKGVGSESGNIDIVTTEGDTFIFNILDEYTLFFKDCKYFHVGFDEYTYRIDEKVDYINKLYNYFNNKGFKLRIWNDSLTKSNINYVNNNIEIAYWDYYGSAYATVDDLEEKGFKVILTNSYYLFFVPSTRNTSSSDLDYTVNDILNNWNINKWDRNVNTNLNSTNNILGSFVCLWSENSTGVDDITIRNQVINMFKAMVRKTNTIRPTKYVIDNNDDIVIDKYNDYLKGDRVGFTVKEKDGYIVDEVKVLNSNKEIEVIKEEDIYYFNMPNSNVSIKITYKKNEELIIVPETIDNIYIYINLIIICISTFICLNIYKKQNKNTL